MFLHALATAVPPSTFTQAECWDIVQRSGVCSRFTKRSRLILHKILNGDHDIATRHFAMPDIEHGFDRTPDELNAAFRTEAPALAGRALTAALEQAGVRPEAIDALLICTCAGYLCPGLTSYVAKQLGLRPNAFLQDGESSRTVRRWRLLACEFRRWVQRPQLPGRPSLRTRSLPLIP